MKIFMPSKGRAHLIKDGTLKRWPKDTPITVVCPNDEWDKYVRATANRGPVHVKAVDVVGISATRQAIGQMAAEDGIEKFIMLDDDLRFSYRAQEESTKLTESSPDEISAGLNWVEKLLTPDTAAAGISARQGNNRLEHSVEENKRLIRTLAFRTKEFLACKHQRVTVMEDFDILLQLLRKGYKNKVLAAHAQDQKGTQTEGGCSTYRTHANHEASARTLAELHPSFVRLVEKKNKTGGEFGTRTEVVISWKKAFESA